MITIDGIPYTIGIVSLNRQAEFFDKYSAIMEDGSDKTNRTGTYYHYVMTLEPSTMTKADYQAFWEDITAPKTPREIVITAGDVEIYRFYAKFEGIGDGLGFVNPQQAYWGGLSITFKSERLVRTA